LLKSDLSPCPLRPLFSAGWQILSPRRERKRKTVFERVIELRVDEVLFKITGHFLFPVTSKLHFLINKPLLYNLYLKEKTYLRINF
jgi:hypothetical protein